MSEEARFIVLAERKTDASVTHFIVEAAGTKAAWAEARRLAKTGATVEAYPANAERPTVELPADEYVVRHARRESKPTRTKKPTVDQLEALATERGVTVPKKVADLIAELREAGQNNDGERREAA